MVDFLSKRDVFGTGGGYVDDLMNALFPDPSKNAGRYLDQIPSTISPYYKPYATAGANTLPFLQENYQQMITDPNSIIDRLGSGYRESPGYQFKSMQGQNAINNAAAAGGMLGTGQHQQQAGELATNLADQDFQKYLDSVLGIFGQGVQGNAGLAQLGYNASNDLATNLAQALMSQSNLKYAGGTNRNQLFGGLAGSAIGAFF